MIHQRGHWAFGAFEAFEASTAAWIYTDNDDFWKGTKREQDVFYAVQGHVIYTFRPGVWVSSSLGYGYGGENFINGIDKNDRGKNLAWSLAAGYSFTQKMGFKIAYIGTQTQTHTGFDSESIAVGFSLVW